MESDANSPTFRQFQVFVMRGSGVRVFSPAPFLVILMRLRPYILGLNRTNPKSENLCGICEVGFCRDRGKFVPLAAVLEPILIPQLRPICAAEQVACEKVPRGASSHDMAKWSFHHAPMPVQETDAFARSPHQFQNHAHRRGTRMALVAHRSFIDEGGGFSAFELGISNKKVERDPELLVVDDLSAA